MSTPLLSKHRHVSQKASRFTESVIREMTREALKHGAVNLSQGFPDFAAPEDIKRVAMKAIEDDINLCRTKNSARISPTPRHPLMGLLGCPGPGNSETSGAKAE